uniref:Uncharacterized protein n=1 Tax=Aegilops tauschii subsp. strangulata TaxID=200361 RepID=A0A453PDR2_AEGTS
LSWLDHGDGHVVDGVRLGRRIGPHRQRGLVRRRGLLRAREQRRLLGRRQLRLVADEHQHHAGHGRPELRALLHAQQARVVAPPRLLLGVRPGQRRVHELRRLVLAPHPPCVLDERVLVLLEVHCAVALAAEDLQHQHPEAVHVRLHREDAPHRVLRRHVPVCSDDVAGVDNLDLLVLEDHGHAEVGDLGVHLVVEEHVAGLEVPVHDLEARVLVEVQQPARDPHHDALPHLPVQVRRLSRTAVLISNSDRARLHAWSTWSRRGRRRGSGWGGTRRRASSRPCPRSTPAASPGSGAAAWRSAPPRSGTPPRPAATAPTAASPRSPRRRPARPCRRARSRLRRACSPWRNRWWRRRWWTGPSPAGPSWRVASASLDEPSSQLQNAEPKSSLS